MDLIELGSTILLCGFAVGTAYHFVNIVLPGFVELENGSSILTAFVNKKNKINPSLHLISLSFTLIFFTCSQDHVSTAATEGKNSRQADSPFHRCHKGIRLRYSSQVMANSNEWSRQGTMPNLSSGLEDSPETGVGVLHSLLWWARSGMRARNPKVGSSFWLLARELGGVAGSV